MGCCGVSKKREQARVSPTYLTPKDEPMPVSKRSTSIPVLNIEPPKETAMLELPDDSEPQLDQIAASKIVNVCTNTHRDLLFSVSEWDAVTPIGAVRRESAAPSERVLQELLRVEGTGNFADRVKASLKVDVDTNRRSLFSATPRSFGQVVDDFGGINEAPISHNESGIKNGNEFLLPKSRT